MAQPVMDTLQVADALQRSGMEREQAEGLTHTLANATERACGSAQGLRNSVSRASARMWTSSSRRSTSSSPNSRVRSGARSRANSRPWTPSSTSSAPAWPWRSLTWQCSRAWTGSCRGDPRGLRAKSCKPGQGTGQARSSSQHAFETRLEKPVPQRSRKDNLPAELTSGTPPVTYALRWRGVFSSVGRATALQAVGRRFKPCNTHQSSLREAPVASRRAGAVVQSV